MARISSAALQQDQVTADRLRIVGREIENLTANILTGVLSPTLVKLLLDREVEKANIEAMLAAEVTATPIATILPHPDLLWLFKQKVEKLCDTLNDDTSHGEVGEILSTLIESVTIYPEGGNHPLKTAGWVSFCP